MFAYFLAGGALLLLLIVTRKWCLGPIISIKNPRKLNGKVIVITGATSGIGLAVLRDLSSRGPRILMLCRNIKMGEKIAKDMGSNVEPFQCDLASLASVRSCVETIIKTVGHVDILINNAGVMACGEGLSEDGYDLQLAVNHLGHFLLTELLRPKMTNPFSKIIITSSFCHIFGKINWQDIHFEKTYSAMKAYGQSKVGNVLHGLELSERLPANIQVCIVNPGVVDTNISRFSWVLQIFFFLGKPWIKSPIHGAQTLIYCCLLNDLPSDRRSIYYSDCESRPIQKLEQYLSESKKFWNLSKDLIAKATK